MGKWLVSAQARWLIVGGFTAVALAVLPALYIKSECSLQKHGRPASYHIAVEGEGTKYDAPTAQKEPIAKRATAVADESHVTEKARAESTYNPAEEPLDWWSKFLCEINIADYTLAYFTIVLAVSTIWLSYVTLRAVRLARDEFHATHRPRIILREAFIGAPLEGHPIEAIMHFANIGDSSGRIVRSLADLEVVPGTADRLLLVSSVEFANEFGDLELAPGQSLLVRYIDLKKRPNQSTPPIWKRETFELKQGLKSNPYSPSVQQTFFYRQTVIHLVGQFLYEDSDGLRRRTAFRRELNPDRQRFYRLDDEPDLEYAD